MRINEYIKPFFVTFFLIALWQLVIVYFALPEYILPTPLQVVACEWQNLKVIAREGLVTLTETSLGLLIAIVFGAAVALFMVFFKRAALCILPILLISQSLPTFAIAPLFVVWFGYGMSAKIITTVLMLFFPITSSFYDGLKSTRTDWLELAKTMNGTPFRIFMRIRIPAALPAFASGLRVATAIAPMGAIVGEWVGASKGLGFLMLNANERMQIDLMFAALITIILFSLSLYFIVDKLLTILIPWQVKNE